ncbi:MAG: cytochrome c oxidase subunit 3 [Bacteroidota bacterium]|nr:cytochrome c oxidase subunit 3 [Bacteroidota bacterium]MDX5429821.1 cytochrome c oxidase subunit 3 [Bacteroidota bacterium]MDX5468600.1 cytochrome c oxidase subunit 3 [Bacteroidota bacterium]
MSTHSVASNDSGSVWRGGVSPFKVSYGKLMMWIFLLSDAFTFSSLLIAYGAERFSFSGNVDTPWPMPDMVFNHFPFAHHVHLPLFFVSLMTFILIFSSVTMVLAVEAGHRNSKSEVAKYMLMTIVGGFAFLGCQAWEWTQFIMDGATLGDNHFSLTEAGMAYAETLKVGGHYEWTEGLRQSGPGVFSALFFIVTGFHGFHVFSGVVLNIIIYLNVLKGTYEKRGHYEMVEKVGLYWHFVDLVWVFVFTFFYLI